MKITIDRTGDDVHIELKREQMPPERFAALCKLAGFTIYGGAVVALVRMIGVFGIIWALVGLVLVGLYKLYKEDF